MTRALLQVFRALLAAGFCVILADGVGAARAAPQGRGDPELDLRKLRREQDEIVRKAQHLQVLMKRLLERYRREDRKRQVQLLERGLEHLRSVGLLEDVTSVRDQLDSRALREAVRKQGEVVDELEKLLAILLDRRSVENLEHEIEATRRMSESVDELMRRQEELQRRTREATRGTPSEAEQRLGARLAELARQEEAEARANARQAGIRTPFLESALQRLQALLREHEKLAGRAREQLSRSSEDPDPVQTRAFQLGALQQELAEANRAQMRARALDRLRDAAATLERAARGDDVEALRKARNQLRERLELGKEADPGGEFDRQARRLAAAGGDREAMARVARAAREQAERLAREHRAAAGAAEEKLAQALQRAASELAGGRPPRRGSAAEALQETRKALEEARKASAAGRDQRARAEMARAARTLAQARKRFARENPDAATTAGKMASESSQIAQSLRATPRGEAGEQRAAESLDRAEQALRGLEDVLRATDHDQATRRRAEQGLETSRQALEAAKKELEGALRAATRDRGDDLRAAAQRQSQLESRAEALAEGLEAATREGRITPQQGAAAGKEMQRARQAMQQARQALENGRQATAADSQQRAAEALRKANQGLERHRPMTSDQRQRLAELAKEQERLEDDIVRLAKLAEERKNRQARQALQEASQAAQRARRAMEQGDREETDQQQEQVKQKLAEARKSLQEERDRYMDLRQEEILFRIKDELVQFLEEQKPITIDTRAAAKTVSEGKRLGRRLRRKLNQLGAREGELARKAEFLRTSLQKEGVLVFSHALQANQDDLEMVRQRLSGSHPDASELTVMLQEEVEERTMKLLEALQREQERRRRNRQRQQDQQQNQPRRNQGPSRQRLVSLVAELELLKQMEQDMMQRTERMEALIAARGDQITELETALIERLANRHHQITQIFLQLKKQMEQALQQGRQEDENGKNEEEDR